MRLRPLCGAGDPSDQSTTSTPLLCDVVRAVTTFHAEACTVMTDLLAKLEEWKMTGSAEGIQHTVRHSATSTRSVNRSSSSRFAGEGIPSSVLQSLEEEAR